MVMTHHEMTTAWVVQIDVHICLQDYNALFLATVQAVLLRSTVVLCAMAAWMTATGATVTAGMATCQSKFCRGYIP